MGVLLMLMSIGGLIAAGVLLVVSFLTNKAWLRNFVLGGVAVWFVFYAVMLVSASLKSNERTLALNEPKEFCGFYLDCHMHTAVSGVRKTKTIGDKTANGEFYVVKVKVFSNAKRATLGLVTVDAHVVDVNRRVYDRDMQAEAELGDQPPFDQQILPVESFEKEIVFDLPADAQYPRLDIKTGYLPERVIETFLIGDEDSIFHKRSYFKLEEQNQVAGVK